MGLKKCIICSKEKPLDEYYDRKSKTQKWGKDNYCKPCRNEYNRERTRLRNPPKEKKYKCKSCLEYLPKEDFITEGQDTRKQMCNTCSSMDIRDFNSWYSQNKDKKYIKDFLDNLRKVTGIYSPEDLIKKHRRF